MDKTSSLIALLLLVCCSVSVSATLVSYDKIAFTLDGNRTMLLSAGIHYPRSTPDMWPMLMQRAVDAGLNTIETYIFWHLHEPERGVYDFSGRLDVLKFISVAKSFNLNVILRVGPYICAEINYGGFPAWLREVPGVQFRTYNEPFMKEMSRWVSYFIDYIRPHLAPHGGNVIMWQIENEYGDVIKYHGELGKKYFKWVIDFADSMKTGVPIIMCQGATGDAVDTVNGFYGHKLLDKHWHNFPHQPAFWTENWSGWYQDIGYSIPYRTAENEAYAIARFFAQGGTAMNYYMFHGGTNFNRTSSYLITTTYDYDAPLDEYGHPREPKFSHLGSLTRLLSKKAHILLANNERPTAHPLGPKQFAYEYRTDTDFITFLCNDDDRKTAIVSYMGRSYTLPAYSIVILDPIATTVLFNTSQVTGNPTRTTKIPFTTPPLSYVSWQEPLPSKHTDLNVTRVVAPYPYESLSLTHDSSDYTWYSRQVQFSGAISDRVISFFAVADIAHVYLNGIFCNSTQMYLPKSPGYVNGTGYRRLVTCAKVSPGTYNLDILVVAWGLIKLEPDIDANMVEVQKGIWGQVTINGQDITRGNWTIQPGTIGESMQIYNHPSIIPWNPQPFTSKPFTWYKLSFEWDGKSTDPVVIRFGGMTKGLAWVNSNCIGRYWNIAARLVKEWDPIGQKTDGTFSQEYYHVPREWLSVGINELIVFEELSGNPALITLANVVYQQ